MKKNIKYIITVVIPAVFLFGLSIMFIFKSPSEYSDSERRKLDQLPQIKIENIINGKYMKDFEEASPDQFPFRDFFRSVKANFSKYVLRLNDNNDIYYVDGHLSKLEYPMKENMLDHAADRFLYVYEKYLKATGADMYLSVVPDKNAFLAEENGYPALDYDKLAEYMQEKLPDFSFIDVKPLLSIDDYYYTDTHWKQQNIIDVAEHIAESMNAPFNNNFRENKADIPFYGVYAGQAALNVKPDELIYLTSEEISKANVSDLKTGKPKKSVMYNKNKAEGKDPYEMFLSGTEPLLTIENTMAEEKRELILFRDSFGSSLAPLLTGSYSKITIIDIRYVSPDMLGQLVDFSAADDVLFMYSTVLLNNSLAIK